jgi:hypothetical protein
MMLGGGMWGMGKEGNSLGVILWILLAIEGLTGILENIMAVNNTIGTGVILTRITRLPNHHFLWVVKGFQSMTPYGILVGRNAHFQRVKNLM